MKFLEFLRGLIPEKVKRYPFVSWGIFFFTVIVLLYVFKDVFGEDWLRAKIDHFLE